MKKIIIIFLINCIIKFLKLLIKNLNGHHIEALKMTLHHIRAECKMLKGNKK